MASSKTRLRVRPDRLLVKCVTQKVGYGRRLVEEARHGLGYTLTGGGQLRDDISWYFEMRKARRQPGHRARR